MATLSLTEFLQNAREPTEEYAIARLMVVPEARGNRAPPQKNAPRNETEELRRRQGRYRRKRHSDLEALQQQNPYAQQPIWKELHIEVKAFRERTNCDSEQEEVNAHATIR